MNDSKQLQPVSNDLMKARLSSLLDNTPSDYYYHLLDAALASYIKYICYMTEYHRSEFINMDIHRLQELRDCFFPMPINGDHHFPHLQKKPAHC